MKWVVLRSGTLHRRQPRRPFRFFLSSSRNKAITRASSAINCLRGFPLPDAQGEAPREVRSSSRRDGDRLTYAGRMTIIGEVRAAIQGCGLSPVEVAARSHHELLVGGAIDHPGTALQDRTHRRPEDRGRSEWVRRKDRRDWRCPVPPCRGRRDGEQSHDRLCNRLRSLSFVIQAGMPAL